jgi:hypothetical protein
LLLRLEFALSRWDEIAFLVRIHDTCKLEQNVWTYAKEE